MATITIECRTTGSDTNGGGFNTAASGTDYSQTDSKRTSPTFSTDISTTDAVAAGTTTITSATANFSTGIIGNMIYFAGGSGSLTGTWRYCTARASSSSITVNATVATGTGITMNIGGALLSPGQVVASIAANPSAAQFIAFVKAGTYSITTTTAGVSGGTLAFGAPANGVMIGYSTNRTFGNTDTPPVIQLNVASASLCGGVAFMYNFTLDGNSQTGANLGSQYELINCTVKNFNTTGGSNNAGVLVGCLFTGNSCGFVSRVITYCEAYGNTATPFSNVCGANNCLSYSNTGASTDGFSATTGNGNFFINCDAVSNGRDGFRIGSLNPNSATLFQNCIAESNTGVGFNVAATSMMMNCSAYGNGTNIASGSLTSGNILPSASVFNNPSGNDFSLNALSARGAALRHAGLISFMTNKFPRATTIGYPDIGAAQSRVPWQTTGMDGGMGG